MAKDRAGAHPAQQQKLRARRFWRGFSSALDAERDFQRQAGKRDPSFYRFCGFAFENIARSRSQFLQDLWVIWEHSEKRDGYFVEFGAASGRRLSNTFLLEKDYGWQGLLAEPNPVFHDRLAKYRTAPVCTDLVHRVSGESVRFARHRRGLLSKFADEETRVSKDGVEEILTLKSIGLNDMLDRYDAPNRIDFMSMDVEGAELDILRGFDFDKHRVACFTIEAKDHVVRAELLALCKKNGYVHRWPDFLYRELYLVDETFAAAR